MLYDKFWPHVLSLFRVIVGTLFVSHGAATIFGILGGNMGSGHAAPVGTWPSWWAALIQLIAGTAVALGLGTRPAALLCSGSMAYAYFSIHQDKALLPIQNSGEPAVMFCWTFLLIAVAGPGTWALDTLLTRTGNSPRQQHQDRQPTAVQDNVTA